VQVLVDGRAVGSLKGGGHEPTAVEPKMHIVFQGEPAPVRQKLPARSTAVRNLFALEN
jgi:hypothetical protein